MFNFNCVKILSKILFFVFIFSDISFFKINSSTLEISNPGIEYLDKKNTNDYIISTGDTLLINLTINTPDLNKRHTVNNEGFINMPRLGLVFVNGLTINELKNLLNIRYKEFLVEPDVVITVTNYRVVDVMVQGEIVNPGKYSLKGSYSINSKDEITRNTLSTSDESSNYYFPKVFDGIKAAGGITSFSDLSDVEIIRANKLSDGGGYKKTTLNFEEALQRGDYSSNIRIYDKDKIIIKKRNKQNYPQLTRAVENDLNPKFINIIVSGDVQNSGKVKIINRSAVLNDALDVAIMNSTIKGNIKFIRFNNDGTIDKRKIDYRSTNKRGARNNPYLMSNDLIVVGKSNPKKILDVITDITKPVVGVLSTWGLIEALSD